MMHSTGIPQTYLMLDGKAPYTGVNSVRNALGVIAKHWLVKKDELLTKRVDVNLDGCCDSYYQFCVHKDMLKYTTPALIMFGYTKEWLPVTKYELIDGNNTYKLGAFDYIDLGVQLTALGYNKWLPVLYENRIMDKFFLEINRSNFDVVLYKEVIKRPFEDISLKEPYLKLLSFDKEPYYIQGG